MTTNTLRDQVRSVLRQWKGSDAGMEAPPEAVADQIDQLYQEYLATLPERTAAIVAGNEAAQREAA